MVGRTVVGAHYGWLDWLAQRITAVVIVVYLLLLLVLLVYHGGMDAALWRSLFAGTTFRIATFVFGIAVLWHAWIGARDIWMDYVKPAGLRLAVEVLTVVTLVAYAGWLVMILWGRAA
jgi:succinate dehydrogenase / fumarate reductase membrane anchor subunit